MEIEAAYAEFRAPLLKLAYLLTFDRHEALDVVQDAFAAATPRWSSIDDPEAYLRRAVINRSFKAKRDRQRRRDRVHRVAAQRRHDIDDVDYLADAIGRLPQKERAIVVLRYYLEMTTAEVAEHLDVPQGSVGPTLNRALRRLEGELS